MMQNLCKKTILVWSGCLTIYIQLQYFVCYNYSLTKQGIEMQKYKMLSVCILFWNMKNPQFLREHKKGNQAYSDIHLHKPTLQQ